AAAYNEGGKSLSRNPPGAICGYFGRCVVSPPGDPGGGITGVLPTSGVGARISGSTPDGGQSTPLPAARRSDSGAESDGACPVVTPGRAFGFDNLLGAQSVLASG